MKFCNLVLKLIISKSSKELLLVYGVTSEAIAAAVEAYDCSWWWRFEFIESLIKC